jgi:ankyrin repeat protein
VLLQRGAVWQVLKVSKSGRTPLSAAANNGHDDVTLLLLQHLILQPGFDINHPRLAANQPLLCCAASAGLYKAAEFALDHGADPDAAGPHGPPLFIAVQAGESSMVQLLCQRGANLQTRFGPHNSLDQAVLTGDTQTVRVLIKHGADVNVNRVADNTHPSAVEQAAVLGDCDTVQPATGRRRVT